MSFEIKNVQNSQEDMAAGLPLFYSERFFKGVEKLLMHPVEFCEGVNQRIRELKLTAIVGIVRAVLAACAFCAAATTYSFGASSLKGRVGPIAFGFLGMILLMKVRSSYRQYVKQRQEIKEEIKQYPKHFQVKDKVFLEELISKEEAEKIQSLIPQGFRKYETSLEKISEWSLQGGEPKRGFFTSIEAKEIESREMMLDGNRSWAELLSFVVQAEEIPESTKKELTRELFPLIDPGHFLSHLPSNRLQLEHLEEGEVVFRRVYSEGQEAEKMIVHGRILGDFYETHFSTPQELWTFLINKYQITENLLDSTECMS